MAHSETSCVSANNPEALNKLKSFLAKVRTYIMHLKKKKKTLIPKSNLY